jgi:hypothetical protein
LVGGVCGLGHSRGCGVCGVGVWGVCVCEGVRVWGVCVCEGVRVWSVWGVVLSADWLSGCLAVCC